jgi:hypothetical protein
LKNAIAQAKACGYQHQRFDISRGSRTLEGAFSPKPAFFNNLLELRTKN